MIDAANNLRWDVRQGDALSEMRKIPDGTIDLIVTSPPYWGLDIGLIWWYDETVRNERGQFVKGHRPSPDTEFKPGQHWRHHQVFREKEYLETEYGEGGRSAQEIATEFGVTENAIYYWIAKHGIRTRTMAETRRAKHWGVSGEDNPMYGRTGPDSPNWKGGHTPERQAFYSTREWADAVKQVWKRDEAVCQRCGAKAEQRSLFHIHHIVSFAVAELRADVNNLVLLCPECHNWVHSNANTEQEFIGGDANGSGVPI